MTITSKPRLRLGMMNYKSAWWVFVARVRFRSDGSRKQWTLSRKARIMYTKIPQRSRTVGCQKLISYRYFLFGWRVIEGRPETLRAIEDPRWMRNVGLDERIASWFAGRSKFRYRESGIPTNVVRQIANHNATYSVIFPTHLSKLQFSPLVPEMRIWQIGICMESALLVDTSSI